MKRLFLHIWVGLLIALVLSVFASGFAMQILRERNIETDPNHPLHREILLATELVRWTPPEDLDRTTESIRRALRVDVRLAGDDDPALPEGFRDRATGGEPVWEMGSKALFVYLPVPRPGGVLVLGPFRPPAPTEPGQIAVLLAVFLAVAGVVGYAMAYPVAKHLQELENAAGKIAGGDLGARAAVRNGGTVGNLADRFNRMAERIQTLVESRDHLLQAVSHELRTPISRIRFQVEMLAESKDEERKEARFRGIDRELDELSVLVDELILTSRLETSSDLSKRHLLPLPEAIEEIAIRFREVSDKTSIEVEAAGKEAPSVYAHPKHFRRAIRNLLSNAVRHSRGRVAVRYGRAANGVAIEVEDDGPGIASEDRERVFEPFARVDGSRHRDTGGVGLGLTIVRRIVESHGGAVFVAEGDWGGARFVTFWPCPPEEGT